MAQIGGEDALARHRHTVVPISSMSAAIPCSNTPEPRIGARAHAPRLDVRERKDA
jgi:hypothetical protein